MVLICHDCQRYFFRFEEFDCTCVFYRHETNRNQYRAMFVFNCTIDENRLAAASKSSQKSSKQKKKNSNKRFKTDEQDPIDTADASNDSEILRPILCSECGTELGVYEPSEELYHFANVLASH